MKLLLFSWRFPLTTTSSIHLSHTFRFFFLSNIVWNTPWKTFLNRFCKKAYLLVIENNKRDNNEQKREHLFPVWLATWRHFCSIPKNWKLNEFLFRMLSAFPTNLSVSQFLPIFVCYSFASAKFYSKWNFIFR